MDTAPLGLANMSDNCTADMFPVPKGALFFYAAVI